MTHTLTVAHAVLTGPITGHVVLPDGSRVDVTAPAVEAQNPAHAAAIAHEIAVRYMLEGHPHHDAGDPFLYLPPTSAQGGLVMALASTAAENASLAGLSGTGSTNVIPYGSLHTASPGTTGANENANAGSYARQACTWNAPSGGSMTNSGTLSYSTAGSTAVTHFGTWSSATYGAGTYAIGVALGSSVTAVTITVAAGGLSLTSA